ncbi:uncharacterized protein [Halyomorpha halys]|uniref:uncharacterized protein n=1 Tax=Halyomorpha halys TaxID=286706 RepID=UPI0006D4D90C|nr:uncharacterized protein LOC106678223 [Halyomorpha halys]
MKKAFPLLLLSLFLFNVFPGQAQGQGQLPPIATGEILTSAFQIPIQTLNAVHGLLQATRGRLTALQERYALQQQMHPNHKLNPTFSLPERRKFQYNSKALYQDRSAKNRQ